MSAPPARVVDIDIDDTLVRSFGSKRIPMSDMVALVPAHDVHVAPLRPPRPHAA